MSKEEESRLANLYGALEGRDKKTFLLPKSVSVNDLKKYIKDMIRINQPRKIRDEGRPSFSIDDYKVPVNYFVVDSNTVSFHASRGSIFIDPDDFDDYMNT